MTDAYTGSDDDLFPILDKAWIDGAELGRLDKDALYAWRDAAVARHLAEAGAVHPSVHTPNRVMRWLADHDWECVHVDDSVAGWRRHQKRCHEWFVYVPVDPEAVDYARGAFGAIGKVAWVEHVPLPQLLLEIALLPDEVAP